VGAGKVSLTVNRSLAFVGVVALAAAQTAVTLGAPPGGRAVSHPAAPAPHPVARGGPANQDNIQLPFHVNVQPLTQPQHFTVHSASFNPQALVPPYRRFRWQSTPGYLWYPALYGPACYASNNFLNTPSDQLPADLTIGSLVDGKSNLLSPQSYNAGYAAGSDPAAASSNPFALQVGFYPTACGAPSFTNL
jgi:hypothetical protein